MADEQTIQEQVPVSDPTPKRKLYDQLYRSQLYTKSYDDFDKKYSSPEAVDNLYGKLNQSQLYTKSRQDFDKQYFGQPIQQTPQPVQVDPEPKPITPFNWKDAPFATTPLPEREDVPELEKVRGEGKNAVDRINNELKSADKAVRSILNTNFDRGQKSLLVSSEPGALERYKQRMLDKQTAIFNHDTTEEDDYKIDLMQNTDKARKVLREVVKLNPEKKGQIEADMYVHDAQGRLSNTKASTIAKNVEAIKNGDLNYNIKTGALQKPSGAVESLVRGFKERNNELDLFDQYMHKGKEGDKFLMETFDKEGADFDPDNPTPTASGVGGHMGEMLGGNAIAMAKGAAITAPLSVIGVPEAGAVLSAFANTPEYANRAFIGSIRSGYQELLSKGVPKEEAFQQAKKQAIYDAVAAGAQGALQTYAGARLGAVKGAGFKWEPGFANTMKGILKESGQFGKEALKTGIPNAAIVGGLEVSKNAVSKATGLDRDLNENVYSAMGSQLLFETGLGLIAKGFQSIKKLTPAKKESILTNIANVPDEQIDATLGKLHEHGDISANEVANAKETINQQRADNTLIPPHVRDENTRVELKSKIAEYEFNKNKLEAQHESFHPKIKERQKQLEWEINMLQETPENQVKILNAKKQELEGEIADHDEAKKEGKPGKLEDRAAVKKQLNEVSDKLEEVQTKVDDPLYKAAKIIGEGKIKGYTKSTIEEAANDPEQLKGVLKEIAEQGHDPASSKVAEDTFGKPLVDIAREMFPKPEPSRISVIQPKAEGTPEPTVVTIAPIEKTIIDESLKEGGTIQWDVYGNEENGAWTVGEKVKTRGGQNAVILSKQYIESSANGKRYTKEYADANGIKYDNEHTIEHIVPLSELTASPKENIAPANTEFLKTPENDTSPITSVNGVDSPNEPTGTGGVPEGNGIRPKSSVSQTEPAARDSENPTGHLPPEGRAIGISHERMNNLSREYGLPEYEGSPERLPEWNEQADAALQNPNAIPKLLDKLKRDGTPDHVETIMMLKYIASLDRQLQEAPTPEVLAELNRAKNLSNIAGRIWGKTGIARQQTMNPEDTFGNYLSDEVEAKGSETLSQEEINQLKTEYDKGQEAKKGYEEGKAKAEEKAMQDAVNDAMKKAKAAPKKSREQFAKERKDIFSKMRADLLKAAKGGQGLSASLPGLAQLQAIAPHVPKLIKSYIEEGVIEFDKIINKLHGDLQGIHEGITEDQVKELVYGDYNIKNKKVPLDAEAQKHQDNYIAFLKETNIRRDNAIRKRMGGIEKTADALDQILGVKRIVQTSIDWSIPFRQGVTIMMNPRQWDIAGKASKKMVLSTFSQKKYDRMMFEMQESPLYKEAKDAGVHFTDADAVDNIKREEDNRTNFLLKIPWIREPFLASNRAASAFSNVARFERFAKLKRVIGKDMETNPEIAEASAKWVNNLTGRGNMISFLESDKGQRWMGRIFYGARLMASRFNLLNPVYYAKMPKSVRVEALKDMGAFAGTMIATGLAASAAGAKVGLDPDSPDFLKAVWGDKRYDLTGGLGNYIRQYARLSKLVKLRLDKSNSDKEDFKYAKDVIGRSVPNFFRYKLAPNTSYALSAIMGKDAMGKPFDPSEIIKIYPMYLDDLKDSWKDDGITSIATVLAPSLIGVGVQDYEDKKGGSGGGGGATGKLQKPTRPKSPKAPKKPE